MLRFSLVGAAYKRIRDTVLNNGTVMRETGIQLAEVNAKTLRGWQDRRSKQQEQQVLLQGIETPTATANPEPIPAAKDHPAALESGWTGANHQFKHPPNTAGQAKPPRTKRKILAAPPASPAQPVPIQIPTYPPLPAMPFMPNPWAPVAPLMPYSWGTPSSTMIAPSGDPPVKKQKKTYKEREGPRKCRACNKPVEGDGHRQYYGNIFCPVTANETEEQWRQRLRQKRNETKKS